LSGDQLPTALTAALSVVSPASGQDVIRLVHGHHTDGIDRHIADLAALFVWAPDTRILEHPIRIAMNEFTAVTGVMRGTFTRPMPDGKGGHIPPTGKSYAINMATIGILNRRKRYMDEEFLFWDNQSFYSQIGLV
jgi:hypothetical protein